MTHRPPSIYRQAAAKPRHCPPQMEQGIYLDELGVEHPTFPEPVGTVWPEELETGRQTLRLRRVSPIN